jgi:hypothetical protein
LQARGQPAKDRNGPDSRRSAATTDATAYEGGPSGYGSGSAVVRRGVRAHNGRVNQGRRQRRGFQRAGEAPLADLRVSARKLREFSLARAWTEAAGPALAAQATVVARRGVLEVAAVDSVWGRTLAPLMPRLALRVAAACPDWNLTRYRLTVQGVASAAPVEAIRSDAAAGQGIEPRPSGPSAARSARSPEPVSEERLRRLAARYGERQKP